MPLRRYPRIEIDQRAYDALQAEGILQHKTSREIATKAILDHVSREAIAFVDRTNVRPLDQTSPPVSIPTTHDDGVLNAVKFIWAEIQADREPTNKEVSQVANIDTRKLGKELGKLGIVTKTVTRDRKTVRIYGRELKPKLESIKGE